MNLEVGYDLDSLFFDLSYDIKLNFPDANANTKIPWGDVASGTVYYYYIDTDGIRHIESSSFYFNTGAVPEMVSVGKVSFFAVRQGSGTTPISISYTDNSILLRSGSLWSFKSNFPPFEHLSSDAYTGADVLTIYTSATGYATFNANATINSYTATTSLGTTADGKIPLKYTTSPEAHKKFPNVPYIPVSGRNMSYNDMRQYVVNQYNEQNPSETININDLPAFDDSTEPTDDIQPFSIDYDEILGERELESILKETQYVLDTTPVESIDFSFPETLPEASAPDASIVSTVGKVFEMHKNIVPSEVVAIWGGLAVFSVLFWWITK